MYGDNKGYSILIKQEMVKAEIWDEKGQGKGGENYKTEKNQK